MASIRKTRSGNWKVQIRVNGFNPITKTFKTKADAEVFSKHTEAQMGLGRYVERNEADNNTLGDLLRRYLTEINPTKKSAQGDEQRINRLLKDAICQLKCSNLTCRALAHWRDQRLVQVSGSTVNRDLTIISLVINIARKEWGLTINNPVSMIRRPPNGKARTRRLLPEEESRLMAVLDESGRSADGTFCSGTRNPWLKPFIQLAIETAMRRGELLKLEWRYVDLDKRTAFLPDTKNGDSRTVPLSSRAVQILQELPKSGCDRVFPISEEAFDHGFRRVIKRSGIQDLRFHDLRHEATSRMAGKLTNILELSAVTGHRDLRMLKRYYHPNAEDIAIKLG